MVSDGLLSMLQPIAGGIVIGVSAIVLLAVDGRIAGVSGIVGGLMPPRTGDVAWRVAFIAGLVCGGGLLGAAAADPFRGLSATSPAVLGVAGLLVGYGASLGSGCTSGHGVCGVSRLSPRSILATCTFMAAGAVTVFVARHVLG